MPVEQLRQAVEAEKKDMEIRRRDLATMEGILAERTPAKEETRP
jgi:hypothetical protein